MQALRRLDLQSLASAAAQRIRSAIILGELRPGDRLVEQKLAAALGTSQSTLREALKELETQGFVRKSSNKGTYVTRLEPEDIREIQEVRLPLEALAVGRAAKAMEPQSAQELSRLVSEMESATRQSDWAVFHHADLEFHKLIWRLAGNRHLERVLGQLVFSLFAFVLSTQGPRDFEDAIRQHRGIVEAILSADEDRARTVFLKLTRQYWQRHLPTASQSDPQPTYHQTARQ